MSVHLLGGLLLDAPGSDSVGHISGLGLLLLV
jgi:hypothetical protein